MRSTRFASKTLIALLCGGALCLALSFSAVAQVNTEKTVSHGPAVKDVTIERGEIVYVSGHSVIIKMEDGTMRHFDNVPESVTFMVDGKPVNINNAKVGMKLEKEVVKTTTPKVVTTVETVSGKVWAVQAPNWVILTMDNGQNQKFTIPKDQVFTVNGKQTDAFGLKKGMVVNAQKVTEVPETVVAQEYKRTGKMPPPPPAPAANTPVLVVYSAPTPAPVETASNEPAPSKLPKTASDLPLLVLLGLLLCAVSLTSRTVRRKTVW